MHTQALRVDFTADADGAATLGLITPNLEQVLLVVEVTWQEVRAFIRHFGERHVAEVEVLSVLHRDADERTLSYLKVCFECNVIQRNFAVRPGFDGTAQHASIAKGKD